MIKRFKLLFLCLIILIPAFQEAESRVVTWNRFPGSSDFRQDSVTRDSWIRIDTFDLEIIPPSSGVKFFRDGILFLTSSKQTGNLLGSHTSFGREESRYARINKVSVEEKKTFSPNIPFLYPSDAVTFSSDSRIMYYTKYIEREGVEKIFKASFSGDFDNNGEWIFEDEPLKFCTGNSIYTHPALSADGKLMVFSSNREESIGAMDLYATIFKDGEWSEPINLGGAVNSTANEMFPYLDNNNNLYFSSDGIQGFGGYDIYICKFKGNTWEQPVNLSKPINTRYDDVAFSVDRNSCKTAFYTVKQNMGKKGQRLLKVSMSNNIPDTLMTLSQYFMNREISQMIILALEPPVQATDDKTETERLKTTGEVLIDNSLTYRIQFLTSFNPGTRSKITVGDTEYDVFEYLYSGAYRLFVGEFKSLSAAVDLQNLLLRNNYPGASVIPFVNGVLSTDPELLTERKASTLTTADKPTEQPVKTITEARKMDKAETTRKAEVELKEPKERVVFRIQFMSSTTSRGSFNVTIGGREYPTWEYFYMGAYRQTIGLFNNPDDAKKLQDLCRNNGFPQAFVAAFRNGERSTDQSLFR